MDEYGRESDLRIEKRNKRIKIAGWLLVLVIVTLYWLINDNEKISVTIADDALICSFTSGGIFEIRLDDIVSLTEVQEYDVGQFVSGSETKRFRFGVWENDLLGAYRLCSYRNVDQFIIFDTKEGHFVINFESNDATSSFYKAFNELLVDN